MGTDRLHLSSRVEERLLTVLRSRLRPAVQGHGSTRVRGCVACGVTSPDRQVIGTDADGFSDGGTGRVPGSAWSARIHGDASHGMSVLPGCSCVARVELVLPAAHVAGAWRVRLEHAITVPVSAASVPRLVSELLAVDAGVLDGEGLLVRLRLADRVAAWAQASASAALADYAGPATSDTNEERQRRFEVRVARSTSDDGAARDIVAARALAGPCRRVRDLWSRGEITGRHVFAVLDRTMLVDDDVTAVVVDRIADRLPHLPSSRVRGEVTRALAKVDPRGQAQRVRIARKHHVGVCYRSMPDGLAQIVATHTVEDARTVMELVDTAADRFLAHRRDCEPCADAVPDEIGPARATAHLALVLHGADRVLDGTVADTDTNRPTCAAVEADRDDLDVDVVLHRDAVIDTVTGTTGDAWVSGANAVSDTATTASAVSAGDRTGGHARDGQDPRGCSTAPKARKRRRRRSRRRGELQVVIDLATLLGLAENPCLVAGEPVPAEIARELATECGSLRRVVTDPVTGYLLDYGMRVYLPEALVRFVQPRDGTCRSPGCGQPAWRCQLDHRVPFPRGASSADNSQVLCKRDHDLKHTGGWTVVRRDPDGTLHWRTRDGQAGVTPPRPYLNDPGDDRWDTGPEPYDPSADPPPF